MSRIQTEFVDKEGNPQNLKQAFEAKFGEAPEVKQHAEAFAYVGEFLSNPQNYTSVKQANGFYSLQGILKTQKAYFDLFYSWDNRIYKWNQLMESILAQKQLT